MLTDAVQFESGGTSLWHSYVDSYELDPQEIALLEQACRCRDELDRIDRLMTAADAQPLIKAVGSMGQPTVRANPLFEEARQHRLLLRKLLSGIRLPATKPQPNATENVVHLNAVAAAHTRWRRRGAPES